MSVGRSEGFVPSERPRPRRDRDASHPEGAQLMSRTVLLKVAGVTVAALIGLAGCAGQQPGPSTVDEPPAQSSTAPSPAGTPAQDEESSTEPKDDAAKPSREDVVAGVAKYFENTGLPADKAKKFAECLADEMYDKSAVKTLQALADGEPTSMDPADAQLFSTASGACTSAVR
jgi:hypothetical protein